MTTSVFFEWLKIFDDYITKTAGRKVLLLADCASCRGVHSVLPELRSVHLEFLPANTTSLCQPLDAGIIAAIKRLFRKRQYRRLLDFDSAVDAKSLYRIDLLTAMIWMRDIWSNVSHSVIQNCWRKTGLVPYPRLA